MDKEAKLKKIKVLSYVFLALVFIAGIFFYSKIGQNSNSAEIVKALTEKNNYSATDELKVKIENQEGVRICFSSCYPYVIQTKRAAWDTYSYATCNKENIAETCIEPKQSKTFSISLSDASLEPATQRLAIPACIGCAIGEQFRVDKIIYSNEFQIKK